jgi:hypothetical protein
MILGMSVSAFALLHVALSLIGIGSGLIVLAGLLGSKGLTQLIVMAVFVALGARAFRSFHPQAHTIALRPL